VLFFHSRARRACPPFSIPSRSLPRRADPCVFPPFRPARLLENIFQRHQGLSPPSWRPFLLLGLGGRGFLSMIILDGRILCLRPPFFSRAAAVLLLSSLAFRCHPSPGRRMFFFPLFRKMRALLPYPGPLETVAPFRDSRLRFLLHRVGPLHHLGPIWGSTFTVPGLLPTPSFSFLSGSSFLFRFSFSCRPAPLLSPFPSRLVSVEQLLPKPGPASFRHALLHPGLSFLRSFSANSRTACVSRMLATSPLSVSGWTVFPSLTD